LPAILPVEEETKLDHYVTLTVRWNGPPDEVEIVGGALVMAAGDVVGAFMPAGSPRIVDVRVAPWITMPEEDRRNIGRALVDTGKDPASWWTARFLQLCAKSDPAHLDALRAAAPETVEAWERWRETSPADDVDDLNIAGRADGKPTE
jgi:hypothetical protein